MTEPEGKSLAWRNRRLIAERLRWPAGSLEDCERIELAHPGWTVHWLPAGIYGPTPSFRAVHLQRRRYYRWAHGADEAELIGAMAEQDRLAADQLAEWRAGMLHGWSVLASQ
ncbi:hypothetical protein [Actinoplanes regularis]|uniref:hypothetical protein n=1 Tax=Actinoplanes regularis TaxID=52697 RepID=UPI0024A59A43|nr:hypothetical protein [Actinoplanes regularis]GLW29450.1 hypothetical protein Areg01_23900 [Actinoplanes regularis]